MTKTQVEKLKQVKQLIHEIMMIALKNPKQRETIAKVYKKNTK